MSTHCDPDQAHVKLPTLVCYAPEQWGEVEFFQQFVSTTYNFGTRTRSCLRGVSSHMHKARIMYGLGRVIRPALAEDAKELTDTGYTPARRSKQLAAVVENVYCELYASVECTCQVVRQVYHDEQGVTNSSSKLFDRACEQKLGPGFPASICDAFLRARDTVRRVRMIRDAVVHTDIGACHWSDDLEKVSYHLTSLGDGQRTVWIADVFAEIEASFSCINGMLGDVFAYLNTTLHDGEVELACRMHEGRFYMRAVTPSQARTPDGGRCIARSWFEADGNPSCPDAQQCQAYVRGAAGPL